MKIIRDEEHREILFVERDPTVKLSKRSQKVLNELQEAGYSEEQLQNRGLIVMFHGKNGRKEDLLPVAERYITAGFSCLLVDLPAHGESPIEETKYVERLDEMVLSVAKKHIDINNQPIYFWGISLGGRYAILSSAHHDKRIFPESKALVLLSTFDNFSYILKEKSVNLFGNHLGQALYQGLAFSLNLFYDFDPKKIDSATLVKSINIPIFMLHGEQDELISYRHGQNLFNQFPTKAKEFHLDTNGDHHNILVTEYPFYLKSILFLLEH